MSGENDTKEDSPKNNGNGAASRDDKRARYLIPVLGTLVVTALTVYVDHAVSKRAERQNNARLATELFSQREQAESELRKDMFSTILRSFLDTETKPAAPESLAERLLKLELLALNFGESLSLGPLFQEINRQILTPASYKEDPHNVLLDQTNYMSRLEGLARRVSDRQVAAFMGTGLSTTFDISVPLDQVTGQSVYRWPADFVSDQYSYLEQSEQDEIGEELSCLQLNGVVRQVVVTLSEASEEMKTLRVTLDIDTVMPKAGSINACLRAMANYCKGSLPKHCAVEIEKGESISFTLDRFNFPMIDNALLSNNQRFATIMRKFPAADGEEVEIKLKGVLFPGEYASLRDKPQLNQAIDHLRRSLPDDMEE